ncbi:MAG: hypothetical protein LUQ38_05195, partial [Methanotrichaceae archaeon]|nr:hypothetical protein [Methanotrichaceae archaeon]
TWDPGIPPAEILDELKGTYEDVDVKVLSSESGEIQLPGQKIKTLNIIYEFKGLQAEKRFAAWNSSRSNRLFLASLSSCSNNHSTEIFDSLVSSFRDLAERELIELEPNSDENAWSIVLRDLLNSFHYRDLSILPATVVKFQVQNSLIQDEGKYHPDSKETIQVNPPLSAFARAAAVQALLRQEGYQARLLQKGKEIGLAVLDPSGKWLPVSINPVEPGRSVGVLVDDIFEATTYKSLEDLPFYGTLGMENLRLDEVLEKDVEPSRYVELQKPDNLDQTWLDNLETVLEGYDYGKIYQENIFDCSNTTQIAWSVLMSEGFDARLMMSYRGHPLDPHIWVVVKYPYEPERYIALETANTDRTKILMHLGRVVENEGYYKGIMYNTSIQYSRLHPNEGMWLTIGT